MANERRPVVPANVFEGTLMPSNRNLQGLARFADEKDVKFVGKQGAVQYFAEMIKAEQGRMATWKYTELADEALAEAMSFKRRARQRFDSLSPEEKMDAAPLYDMLHTLYDRQLTGMVWAAGESLTREVSREIELPDPNEQKSGWEKALDWFAGDGWKKDWKRFTE